MLSREEVRNALTGPMMSLSMPFGTDGAIDYSGIRQIIDYTIEAGTKTIILTQGDSLYTILTDEEVAEVTRVVVEHTARRAMVVAADRSWWLGKEVAFAQHVRQIGADMLMVLPPDWATSCTTDTFVEHYGAVAEHIPVMVVTNVFAHRPLAQSLDIIRRLRDEVDGIYAVKDDLCGLLGRRLGLLVHDRWAVVASGNKRQVLNNVPYGCDGYMSCFILFKPDVAHEFWRAVQAADQAAIRRMIQHYDVPFWDIFVQFQDHIDAVIHGVQELNGLAQRWRRKPYYSLSELEMEKLSDIFRDKGWI